MKTELKAKFLQFLTQKKKDEGFTLIELLVVLILSGILFTIALPSFFNQATKGKQSEAKQYVAAMNRAQQAYYLQEGVFTNNLNELGVGIKSQTESYKYELKGDTTKVANNGVSLKGSLKSYAGVVILSQQQTGSKAVTLVTLCESIKVGEGTAQDPQTSGTAPQLEPSCPSNFVVLKIK
jgi:prepilin-type N-terminal cleavage/methylation domain-containing protein